VLKVKDLMKRNVIYFSPEDSIFEVARVFSREGISGAPVIENGKVVGVISETDLIRFLKMHFPKFHAYAEEPHFFALLVGHLLKEKIQFHLEMKKFQKIKVREIMSKSIISVSPEATIIEAAELMDKYAVDRLPVIANKRLVGLITKADLIRVFLE
jgi:CBS domain-containing protein